MKTWRYLIPAVILAWSLPHPLFAEVKSIEAGSGYVMGDNDSKITARKIATQEAQRKALELAGTYVESLTEVKNYKLTKDEIKAYTAGILETKVLQEEMRGTAERPEIYIKVRCKIDTDDLLKQIERYRENEELKEQLMATADENKALKKERDQLIKQLGKEKDKSSAEDTRKKLDLVLAKAESNDETNKVWTNLALESEYGKGSNSGTEVRDARLKESATVLERAIRINPQNQRARVLLATIHHKEGRTAMAERELREVLDQNPANPFARMRLGVLLRETGRYEEALKEFRYVERKRPGEVHMLFHTGMTFRAMGACKPAISYLSRFLKRTKHNTRPKFERMRRTAVRTITACGGKPGRRPVRHRPRRYRY